MKRIPAKMPLDFVPDAEQGIRKPDLTIKEKVAADLAIAPGYDPAPINEALAPTPATDYDPSPAPDLDPTYSAPLTSTPASDSSAPAPDLASAPLSSTPAPDSSSTPAPDSSSTPAPDSSSTPAPDSSSAPAPDSSSAPAPDLSSAPLSSTPAPDSSSAPTPDLASAPLSPISAPDPSSAAPTSAAPTAASKRKKADSSQLGIRKFVMTFPPETRPAVEPEPLSEPLLEPPSEPQPELAPEPEAELDFIGKDEGLRLIRDDSYLDLIEQIEAEEKEDQPLEEIRAKEIAAEDLSAEDLLVARTQKEEVLCEPETYQIEISEEMARLENAIPRIPRGQLLFPGLKNTMEFVREKYHLPREIQMNQQKSSRTWLLSKLNKIESASEIRLFALSLSKNDQALLFPVLATLKKKGEIEKLEKVILLSANRLLYIHGWLTLQFAYPRSVVATVLTRLCLELEDKVYHLHDQQQAIPRRYLRNLPDMPGQEIVWSNLPLITDISHPNSRHFIRDLANYFLDSGLDFGKFSTRYAIYTDLNLGLALMDKIQELIADDDSNSHLGKRFFSQD